MKRDPANSARIILSSLTIDSLVVDFYDFDWTREEGSPSRKGATVQIGWEPQARNEGQIFATETEVIHTFTAADDNLIRFNKINSIDLNNIPTEN